ncbi:Cellobiose 2-epimerase [subsurface metagenome]
MWLLSTLYSEVEPRPQWLELAKHGIDFIERFGFDADGKMFFQVTRAGDPLRKRRYLFTEGFGVLAFAAYGKAACDQEYIRKAYDLYSFMEKYPENPDRMLPKVNSSVRPTKAAKASTPNPSVKR